jgi:hypothetical protein
MRPLLYLRAHIGVAALFWKIVTVAEKRDIFQV